MRAVVLVVVVHAVVACSSKKQDKPADQPLVCPSGQLDQAGTCVVVVTPDTIAAVTQEQARIDELATLLQRADALTAPIDVLNGLHDVPAWKALVATNETARHTDELAVELTNAAKAVRAFQGTVGELSTRLGNVKGELEALLVQTATTQKLEYIRADISEDVEETVVPFAANIVELVQGAIRPVAGKLGDASAAVDLACITVMLKGPDQAKPLCKDAKAAFAQASSFLADVKARPAALYTELSTTLTSRLDLLVNDKTRQALAGMQERIDKALAAP